MKAVPLKVGEDGYEKCSIEESTHVLINLPCCFGHSTFPVQRSGTRKGTGNWSWNGDTEAPTLKPSIVVYQNWAGRDRRSHLWLNDGKCQYLSDCSHDLKNKTVDLLEVDESWI